MLKLTTIKRLLCFSLFTVFFVSWMLGAKAQSTNPQSSAQDALVTNLTVVEMVKANLPSDLIVARIQTSKTAFDFSTDALVELRNAAVPSEVIKAMMRKNCRTVGCASDPAVVTSSSNDPTVPHAPGIYVYNATGEPKMTPLEPTVYSQTRTSGELAYSLTLGIARIKSRAVISGAQANMHLRDANPTFYFYFEQKAQSLSCRSFCGNSTPHEFTLLKFEVKSDARETVVSRYNIVGSSRGTDRKSAVLFVFEKIQPGIYKVTFTEPLQSGEYCFFSNAFGGYRDRLFDFGVGE
jgi:hypothetical protein